jgi:hypothetical protein
MKTKTRAAILFVTVSVLTAVRAHAYPVEMPPGNIVQNGNFQSLSANWSGSAAGFLGAWASVPNDAAALATDIYQDLRTNAGQEYSLSFYAAADLFFGPSTAITINLNHTTLLSFTTPPYAYDTRVERYDQMHWQKVTGSFVASLGGTRLEFVDMNTQDFGLAAVSVVPVPEPTSFVVILVVGTALAAARRYFRIG